MIFGVRVEVKIRVGVIGEWILLWCCLIWGWLNVKCGRLHVMDIVCCLESWNSGTMFVICMIYVMVLVLACCFMFSFYSFFTHQALFCTFFALFLFWLSASPSLVPPVSSQQPSLVNHCPVLPSLFVRLLWYLVPHSQPFTLWFPQCMLPAFLVLDTFPVSLDFLVLLSHWLLLTPSSTSYIIHFNLYSSRVS